MQTLERSIAMPQPVHTTSLAKRRIQLALVFVGAIAIASTIIVLVLLSGDIENLHRVSIGIGVFGALDAIYLSAVAIWGTKVLPRIYHEPYQAVKASGYMNFLGVPNAWWGVATYAILIAGASVACTHPALHGHCVMVTSIFATIGFIFSIRLMRAMFLKIRRVCAFCVISAITMTVV